MITDTKSYQKIQYQNGVHVTRIKSLPYNNFKTLKILFRFPRAKVNSNKIFKPSGWIKPSSLEQNKRKEIQLHGKDSSLMAHIKYSKDKKNRLKNCAIDLLQGSNSVMELCLWKHRTANSKRICTYCIRYTAPYRTIDSKKFSISSRTFWDKEAGLSGDVMDRDIGFMWLKADL